jgi:hypothetical protein
MWGILNPIFATQSNNTTQGDRAMRFHELVQLKVRTHTIRQNIRLLKKLEEKERRVQNNQLLLDAPSLVTQKQILRRSK